ncbi:MAG: holin, BlyA family protein, partial [Clostridiales bacterium]|nr:holin, BlyA family protein [Clostridiales bacterium]
IVIGLVIIFKDRMTALVNSIFSSITSKSNTILR